jgi:acetate kinase
VAWLPVSSRRGWPTFCRHAARKKLAFDLVLDRILTYLGSYHLKLGGEVDALVFAGGIGEKSAELRAAVVRAAACLGFALDERANAGAGEREDEKVVDIGRRKGGEEGKRVLVCWTDEQEEMARECALEDKFWQWARGRNSALCVFYHAN